MELKKISKVINAFPSSLTKEERKIQILALWMLIPFFFVLSYVWFGILIKLNFIPFFLAFCTMLIGMTAVIYYWDELDKKYGLKPIRSSFKLSYQGYVILFLIASPMFFFLGLALGLTSGNVWFGLGGAIAIVYPTLGIFLRIKTFSDDSILISKGKTVLPEKVVLPDGKELSPKEREVTETIRGFGFMPIAYWILSALLGLYITGGGFSDIYLHFAKGFPSLEAAIFTIILGLLVQSVYLFPDKLNKVVPVELRSKNGFWFMVVLVFVLFGVSQFVVGVVTGLTA